MFCYLKEARKVTRFVLDLFMNSEEMVSQDTFKGEWETWTVWPDDYVPWSLVVQWEVKSGNSAILIARFTRRCISFRLCF